MGIYTITIHKAQGATFDKAIYYHDSKEQMTSANSFYVAITRSRQNTKIFTDNLDALRKQAAKWYKKTSVLDYFPEKPCKIHSLSGNNAKMDRSKSDNENSEIDYFIKNAVKKIKQTDYSFKNVLGLEI